EPASPTGDTIAAHRRRRRLGDAVPGAEGADDAPTALAPGEPYRITRVPHPGVIDSYPSQSAVPVMAARAAHGGPASQQLVDGASIDRVSRGRARRTFVGLGLTVVGVVVLG